MKSRAKIEDKKVVILVSGGLDSTTVLGIAKELGYQIYALSFDYSQRNDIELQVISENIKNFNVIEHKIIKLDLSFLRGPSLVDKSSLVEKYRDISEISDQIPNTYVPARNTIFLSYALSYAENISADEIFIGIHKTDSPNYPDCTEDFRASFEDLANIATSFIRNNIKIKITAPLIKMTKSEIVKKGTELYLDYSKTISCYDPSYSQDSDCDVIDKSALHCGKCASCLIRLEAFEKNQLKDPARYKK